jgi:TPR repeat protein
LERFKQRESDCNVPYRHKEGDRNLGKGVPKDYAEAVKWYRLAAAQGNANAQLNLGVMYANGHGVPEDYVQAYAWMNLAAAQGNKDNSKNKNSIRKLMTPGQIAEAQKLSKTLCAKIPSCTH